MAISWGKPPPGEPPRRRSNNRRTSIDDTNNGDEDDGSLSESSTESEGSADEEESDADTDDDAGDKADDTEAGDNAEDIEAGDNAEDTEAGDNADDTEAEANGDGSVARKSDDQNEPDVDANAMEPLPPMPPVSRMPFLRPKKQQERRRAGDSLRLAVHNYWLVNGCVVEDRDAYKLRNLDTRCPEDERVLLIERGGAMHRTTADGEKGSRVDHVCFSKERKEWLHYHPEMLLKFKVVATQVCQSTEDHSKICKKARRALDKKIAAKKAAKSNDKRVATAAEAVTPPFASAAKARVAKALASNSDGNSNRKPAPKAPSVATKSNEDLDRKPAAKPKSSKPQLAKQKPSQLPRGKDASALLAAKKEKSKRNLERPSSRSTQKPGRFTAEDLAACDANCKKQKRDLQLPASVHECRQDATAIEFVAEDAKAAFARRLSRENDELHQSFLEVVGDQKTMGHCVIAQATSDMVKRHQCNYNYRLVSGCHTKLSPAIDFIDKGQECNIESLERLHAGGRSTLLNNNLGCCGHTFFPVRHRVEMALGPRICDHVDVAVPVHSVGWTFVLPHGLPAVSSCRDVLKGFPVIGLDKTVTPVVSFESDRPFAGYFDSKHIEAQLGSNSLDKQLPGFQLRLADGRVRYVASRHPESSSLTNTPGHVRAQCSFGDLFRLVKLCSLGIRALCLAGKAKPNLDTRPNIVFREEGCFEATRDIASGDRFVLHLSANVAWSTFDTFAFADVGLDHIAATDLPPRCRLPRPSIKSEVPGCYEVLPAELLQKKKRKVIVLDGESE